MRKKFITWLWIVLLTVLPLTWAYSGDLAGDTEKDNRGLAVKHKESASKHCSGLSHAATYRALIIGNNAYRHWQPLTTAVKDAEELYSVLTTIYGFPKENVQLLTNATRVNILDGFDRLANTSQPLDNVLVYYAGHGHYDDHGRGYWVPVDGKVANTHDYISNEEVLAGLNVINGRHKLLISDSCFSGTLLVKQRKGVGDLKANRYFQEKNRLASIQGMTSGGTEPVSDGGRRWQGHSIFAYHLLAHLKANRRRCLAANLLGQQVAESVTRSSKQAPILRPIYGQGDQGGEFFFVRQSQVNPPVMVVVSHDSQQSPKTLKPAAQLITSRITRMLTDLGYPLVPGRFEVSKGQEGPQLSRMMIDNNAQIAVVCSLDSKIYPERTVLWEGKARLAVDLTAYSQTGGEVRKIERYPITAQVIPFRRWSDSEGYQSEQFLKAAQKIVTKWADATINEFLFALADSAM